MLREPHIDKAINTLLDNIVADGFSDPHVYYDRAPNGVCTLEIGHSLDESCRRFYRHTYNLIDNIGTEAKHISVHGRAITEVLKAHQQTKH